MRSGWFHSGLVRLGSGLLAAGWAAGLGLAFVPLYLRLIGVEAYGLLGFYAALTTLVQVLDLGLSPTMNRELARYTVHPEQAADARDFVRTVEIGYWGLGALLGLGLAALAPWLARDWLNPVALTSADVQAALVGMAVLTFLQWPISLYQGGLLGLERQVVFNASWIAFTTVRHVGAWIALSLNPSVVTYFLWQIAASAVYVAGLAVLLWWSLPRASKRPRFAPARLQRVWKFAAGLTTITITALIMTQIDKVLLSRWLSLEAFGQYALAATVAGTVAMLVGPINNVVFPRLSALVAQGRPEAVSQTYHRSAQIQAALILPVATILIAFAEPLVAIWTRDTASARAIAPIVQLLTLGSALNGLLTMPFSLQLAHGWTRLGVWVNLFLLALVVPAVAFSAAYWGGQGVALIWVAVNVVYGAISVPLTHRRLLPGELGQWLTIDTGRAAIVCALCGSLGVLIMAGVTVPGLQLLVIAGTWLAATLAAGGLSPAIRVQIAHAWATWRARRGPA